MIFKRLNAGCPVNKSHPLTTGLAGWWKVCAGGHPSFYGGRTLRDLMRKNNGTFNSATWGGSSGRPGQFGSVVTVASSSQYVSFNNPLSGTLTGITMLYVGSWSISGTSDGAVVSISDGSFDSEDFGIQAFSGSNMRGFVRDGGGTRHTVAVVNNPGGGEYAHWWVVADGSNLYTYKNATIIDSTATGSGFDISGGLALGTNGQRAQSFASINCNELFIWNRALSAIDREAVMQSVRKPDNPMLNWNKRLFVNSSAAPPIVGGCYPFLARVG